MTEKERFMSRCIQLAAKGLGKVAPNPLVGCVIVHKGKIIGEGFHQKFGEPHAEVNAINSVIDKQLLPESSLYVNLEPCSHFGKTPPCADLIIQKGIKRVVVGSQDPNPKVSGKGIKKLLEAGVEVITDILKHESDYLNRRFIAFHTKHRPFLILKWAQSADGFMALDELKPFWFTNNESKKLTHKWRSEEQGILVGRKTVEIDDCELTVRLWQGENPLRIVIDKNASLPSVKKIFNSKSKTIVFNHLISQTNNNVQFIKIDFAENVIEQMLNVLYKLEIQSVIIEGGNTTLSHFIKQNVWDEARVFTSRHIIKTGKCSPLFSGRLIEEENIEDNVLRSYSNTIV